MWVSLRRTGKMLIACESGLEKITSVKKLWTKQNIWWKNGQNGRFPFYFCRKLFLYCTLSSTSNHFGTLFWSLRNSIRAQGTLLDLHGSNGQWIWSNLIYLIKEIDIVNLIKGKYLTYWLYSTPTVWSYR